MPIPTYRPRALLRLFVPIPDEAEPLAFDVDVRRARLELNDHNHADKLTVEVDWIDTGVDPRWIAGGTCEFYLGSADNRDRWEPNEQDLRFVGRLVRPARSAREEERRVELEFHDYTSFFLLAKPVAAPGVPLYSETLTQAWTRLCAEVPGVEQLKDNLEYRGLTEPPLLGAAVAERFRRAGGSVHVTPNADAWAIWQQCVGMAGLLSFFELDRCIVTTATDYYTAAAPPRLIWGRNILELREERNNDRGQRGVGITSYDPLTGRALEAIYDPLAGKRKAKKPAAKKRRNPQTMVETTDVDFFQVPGLTEPAALEALARRVYEERARQELDGTVTTSDMSAATADGKELDLLALRSGDTIEIRLHGADDAEFVRSFASRSERKDYLVGRGYSESVAAIIAANVDRLTDKSNLFYVKAATIDLESNEDGGSFRVEIQFINKIDPSGGTAAA